MSKRTIWKAETEDYIIAESEEEALRILREFNPDFDYEYGEPVRARPLDEKPFTIGFECLSDIPERFREFAIETSPNSGCFKVTRQVSEWAEEEPGYLCSQNY